MKRFPTIEKLGWVYLHPAPHSTRLRVSVVDPPKLNEPSVPTNDAEIDPEVPVGVWVMRPSVIAAVDPRTDRNPEIDAVQCPSSM